MATRWGRRWLIALAVIVVAVGAAAAAATALIDPNAQKGRIEQAVERATGRQFRIAGPVRVRWGLAPGLAATDVSLANMPGGSRPDMATASAVEARLALLPLLLGRVEIASATLVRPDILIETDAAGRGNWLFQRPAALTGASPSTPHPRAPTVVDTLQVEDARLTWHDGVTGRTAAVNVPHASLEMVDDVAHLAVTAALNGAPVTLAGQVDTAGHEGLFPAKLTAASAGATLVLDGAIDQVSRSVHGRASLVAPDLAALSPLAGTQLLPLKDVHAHASLKQGQTAPSDIVVHAGSSDLGSYVPGATLAALDFTWPGGQPARLTASGSLPAGPWTIATGVIPSGQTIALRGLTLTAPMVDLSGDVALARSPRPGLRGTLVVNRLDATATAALLRARTPPAVPPPPSGAATPAPAAAPARLFPDSPLPWAALRRADADLQFTIATLHAGGADYRNAAGHLVLEDGVLTLDPATIQAPEGRVDLSASADSRPEAPPVVLNLRSAAFAIDPLLQALGLPGGSAGAAEVDVALHAAGSTPHALAASLDGHAGLAMVDGAVASADLAAVAGKALHEAGLRLDPAGQSTVRCLALRLDAKSGQVALTALALDTSRLLLEGGGAVDLAAETLALRLRPTVRLGGAALTTPVRIEGSLLQPAVAMDAANGVSGRPGITIGSGGAVAADACGPALAAARDGHPGPPPAEIAAAKPPKPADLLRSFLR